MGTCPTHWPKSHEKISPPWPGTKVYCLSPLSHSVELQYIIQVSTPYSFMYLHLWSSKSWVVDIFTVDEITISHISFDILFLFQVSELLQPGPILDICNMTQQRLEDAES